MGAWLEREKAVLYGEEWSIWFPLGAGWYMDAGGWWNNVYGVFGNFGNEICIAYFGIGRKQPKEN